MVHVLSYLRGLFRLDTLAREGALLFLLFCLLLQYGGCFLDTSTIELPRSRGEWTAKATPGIVCPTDDITVSWDVGRVNCGAGRGDSCQIFTALHNGEQIIDSTYRTGSENLGTFDTRNQVFRFNTVPDPVLLRDGPISPFAWEIKDDFVRVLTSPTDGESESATAVASCVPSPVDLSFRVWNLDRYSVDLGTEEFIARTKGYGDCVSIVRIVRSTIAGDNIGDLPVLITSSDGSLNSRRLEPGGIIDSINLPNDVRFDIEVESGVVPFRQGGPCERGFEVGEGGTETTPVFEVIFSVACDVGRDECEF